MNHTKEPWYEEYYICDEESPVNEPIFSGEILASPDDCAITPTICYGVSEANAKRIVACVNACAGITNEALEAGIVKKALVAYLGSYDKSMTWNNMKVWEDV